MVSRKEVTSMMLNFRKSKVTTDQNLMPQSLITRYLYQRTVMPVLIVILTVVAVSLLIFYGLPQVTENIQEKTNELMSQSLLNKNALLSIKLKDLKSRKDLLQNEYDNYYEEHPLDVQVNDSILKTLRSQISALQQELRDLEDSNNDDIENKYHVEKLFAHIDAIRTEEITVISLEDSFSSNATTDGALVYKNDVGEATFSLHGLATESRALSEFLLAIKECEYIKDAKILSIETQTVSEDQNIYVFEVSITPLVEEE